MPNASEIARLLPHLSASEWRTSQQVARLAQRSVPTVARSLTIAASAGIVRRTYQQQPGERELNPRAAYRLRELVIDLSRK